MKKWIKVCKDNDCLAAWLVLIISIVMIVVSWIMPPQWVIDASVLAAVGELNLFGILWFRLPNMIQSIKDGRSVSIKHGDTEIEVSSERGE